MSGLIFQKHKKSVNQYEKSFYSGNLCDIIQSMNDRDEK